MPRRCAKAGDVCDARALVHVQLPHWQPLQVHKVRVHHWGGAGQGLPFDLRHIGAARAREARSPRRNAVPDHRLRVLPGLLAHCRQELAAH
jgi:hypothetical protein